MVAYICDCKKDCSESADCHKNGGVCVFTFDPAHAANGESKYPHKEPDRFEIQYVEIAPDEVVTYFWERELEKNA